MIKYDDFWLLYCRLQEMGFERSTGVTQHDAYRRWCIFSQTSFRHLIPPPWSHSLGGFQWCSMLSLIVSPHGYFGQANVLGLPDTGGQLLIVLCFSCFKVDSTLSLAPDSWCIELLCQVVYILDQVRALESEMLLRIQKQGLDVVPKIRVVSTWLLCSTLNIMI